MTRGYNESVEEMKEEVQGQSSAGNVKEGKEEKETWKDGRTGSR